MGLLEHDEAVENIVALGIKAAPYICPHEFYEGMCAVYTDPSFLDDYGEIKELSHQKHVDILVELWALTLAKLIAARMKIADLKGER